MVVETYCIRIIQALRSSISLASTFGLIISDCKQILQEIADIEYYFVKRSANKVAHYIARQSCFV